MKAVLRVCIAQVTELVAGDFHTAAKLEDGTPSPPCATSVLPLCSLPVLPLCYLRTSLGPARRRRYLYQASIKPLLSLY